MIMIDNLKNHFDNLFTEDKNNILNIDFSQSIDKLYAPINNEDIEDILLAEETSDDGGIIAMTGFYYQMMVAVLYLGEVFQGDWDGMFLDHHQDIVLFNNSKKIIKFIQVKTKNSTYAPANKKIVESWIPKLFITAFNIKQKQDFNLKFELVSNCFFQDQKNFNISPFYPDSESRSIEETKQMISASFGSKVINYNDNNEDFLDQAFENFNMRHIPHESLEEKVVRNIPISLGFVNNQLSQDMLDHIISEFFKSCYNPEDASVQLISGERLNKLKGIIKKQLENSVVNAYHTSSEKIFTDYLTKLDKEYSHPKMKSDFIKEFRIFLDRFDVEIKKTLSSSDLTMMGIINRYLKYNESINVMLEESDRKEHFNDLFSLLLFLKISIESDIKIDEKNRHILSVNLDKLLFLVLGNDDNFREPSEIIKEFKDLFQRLDDSEKFRIFYSGNISVIISGKFYNENSSEYTTLKKEELDFYTTPSINNPKLDDMSTNNIKDVQAPINILYAHRKRLAEINDDRIKYNNLVEMKNKIVEELQLDGII
ncbi:TPA: DUF4297 domain-containing protein [Streptococcus pneumoniae]|nr:DUF4297 domain-containing protein [Streptococcus pneumoniae]MBS0666761.1 DUF4297 domain-containing protein [Streptococcus pneumoniae]MBS0678969.1 DUF4297 domain-containing protein [Streptococcus pneumoniae]PKF46771.1 DUF4297 domain-containing protein [Streptococcus pneumoniae]QPN72969.1 DUF4297 domain-containing protein [Streptococcus pneumoniae]